MIDERRGTMKQLFKWLDQEENLRQIKNFFINGGCNHIHGVGGSAKHILVAQGIDTALGATLLITSSSEEMEKWKSDLQFLVPTIPIFTFPFVVQELFSTAAKSMERVARQMEVLAQLREDKKCIILTTVEEASQYIIAPSQLDNRVISFEVKQEYERAALLEKLIQNGYERVELVERCGHFSIRGDILDIYAVNQTKPIRLEFFGDTIEKIRLFDVLSQTSIQTVEQVQVLPFSLSWDEHQPYNATILDYLHKGQIIWDEPNRLRDNLKKALTESDDYVSHLCPWRTWVTRTYPCSQVLISLLSPTFYDMKVESSIHLVTKRMSSFQKQFSLLKEELLHWHAEGKTVVLVIDNLNRKASLQAWMQQEGFSIETHIPDTLQKGVCYLVTGNLQNGFEFPHAHLVVLCERDIYGMQKRRLFLKHTQSQKINTFTDLKKGDYVVHHSHGIGRYMGLKTMEIDDVHRDYLEIHYAGNDILYVPIEQMALVQRYIGNEGDIPKLHRMGGKDWQKARAKAQKSVDNLAEKLLSLYAKREVVSGFAYPPDTPFQREFEEAFPYEETEDQLRAVAEIKKYMERPFPMDCLVCGDVGFGKTEVAMRAIFKAVMSHKQVAVLVPTTVLAQQHFLTFTERLSSFGVQCEVLNRFRSVKERKDILARTKLGQVDVLIGTHSILNKQVQFKQLGLLVVDEEQRFGVAQKEKWKSLAAHVDVLSLSATPIPRTLHMSLVKLREMCIMETPPIDRFPVQTYVTEYDPTVIREAITREKRRGGQVFFIYNQVESMGYMKNELERLVPELSIAMAHGQMSGAMLEAVMFDFYEGKYDILLCSSLVENGLDVANANTIIVYDADHFGLSQLYQMRGRVGRSHNLAYAYLCYRKNKVLSEIAEKRLSAIKEFTELGSGFKIAMRDLEIRGAGNLLGREQHGNIAGVGFSMYCQMLEGAIKRLQNGISDVTERIETVLDIQVNAYIDNEYITNNGQKIDIYQRLAIADTSDEINALEKELTDRYGTMTAPVKSLLQVAIIRVAARKLGITLISQKKDYVEIKWQQVSQMPHLSALEPALQKRVRYIRGLPTVWRIDWMQGMDIISFINYLIQVFCLQRKGTKK